MTYAPATIAELGRLWVSHGGVNLGVVGDSAHAASGGYHEGKDDLVRAGVLATDYSVKTARDKAGLSNAASAIDLGRLDGSLDELRAFSRWFVERCRANAPGTVDVREFIYYDGTNVLRWDRERGVASAPRPGEADASHITHSHCSFYRDAENRSKVGLFAPYFEEAAMAINPVSDAPAAICDVLAGGPLWAADRTTVISGSWGGAKNVGLYTRPVVTSGMAAIRIQRSVGGPMELAFVPNNKVTAVRTPGPDSTPISQALYDAALAKVALVEADLAKANAASAEYEKRITAAKAALG